jgi:hypothetical protein
MSFSRRAFGVWLICSNPPFDASVRSVQVPANQAYAYRVICGEHEHQPMGFFCKACQVSAAVSIVSSSQLFDPCVQVPVCNVCISSGEKHSGHSVSSVKAAAGDAKAAVEGHMKAAQDCSKAAGTMTESINSKLSGRCFASRARIVLSAGVVLRAE